LAGRELPFELPTGPESPSAPARASPWISQRPRPAGPRSIVRA
jgi:hypothetical protein